MENMVLPAWPEAGRASWKMEDAIFWSQNVVKICQTVFIWNLEWFDLVWEK